MRNELNALVPITERTPDWGDVLARAEPPFWRRRAVLAVAVALAGLAAAGAVTAALGGFNAWLNGEPGKPAPSKEQQRFEAANGRTWAAFPTSTKLRELIDTTIDGKRYVLFGFKSGNTLCLKLKAVSLGHSTRPRCAPLSLVSRISSPIVLVDSVDGFQDRHADPSAEFSFGIVADGVSRVAVRALDGTHRALVRSNAYLWVENEPNTGNRIVDVTAFAGRSRTRVAPTNWVNTAPVAHRLPGPTRPQHRITHPHIGWYDSNQHRGHVVGGTTFIKPDPLSNVVVGLDGQYCLSVSLSSTQLGGRGCSPRDSFFMGRGFNVLVYGEGGEFPVLAGAAADGVKSMKVFLSDGMTLRIALKDNLFAALAPWSGFPARVVAYDSAGRVVGVERVPGLAMTVPRAATTDLSTRIQARGPHGGEGVLRFGRPVRHMRCWRLNGLPITCSPTNTGPAISPDAAVAVGRDVFVAGAYGHPIVRVELRFPNGDAVRANAAGHMFLVAVPKKHLATTRLKAMVLGLDAAGEVVQRRGVVYRANH